MRPGSMADDAAVRAATKHRPQQVTRADHRRQVPEPDVAEKINVSAALAQLREQPALGGNGKLVSIPSTRRERRQHPLDPAVQAAARNVEGGHVTFRRTAAARRWCRSPGRDRSSWV